MNNVRSDQCFDSLLYNTFGSPFTTSKLTTAIFKLSTSAVSDPDPIAYLLTHLLLLLNNIFSPSSTGPGLRTPFPPARNPPQLSPYTNLENLPNLRPPIVQSLLFPVSGVATREVSPPLCGKCDVIFSYIYTNTTKLVFHLSYLVRLDRFKMLLIDELLLKNNQFGRNMHKMRYFYWKIVKIAQLWGFAPRPLASDGCP